METRSVSEGLDKQRVEKHPSLTRRVTKVLETATVLFFMVSSYLLIDWA